MRLVHLHKVLKRLGEAEELYVSYEAGVTGYGLAGFLMGLGIKCMVVAHSKIPQVPGPKVKTDRKDAIMRAEKLKAASLFLFGYPMKLMKHSGIWLGRAKLALKIAHDLNNE
jgi:hypothetical protein